MLVVHETAINVDGEALNNEVVVERYVDVIVLTIADLRRAH